MFERRLKVLLVILLVACAALAIRAAQIQLLQRDLWRKQATELMKRGEFIETTRGTISDRNGVPLVDDAPCVDACVDFRAINEEPVDHFIARSIAADRQEGIGGSEGAPPKDGRDGFGPAPGSGGGAGGRPDEGGSGGGTGGFGGILSSGAMGVSP